MGISAYKKKLWEEIEEYMKMDVTPKTTAAVMGMLDCYRHLDDTHSTTHLSHEDITEWVRGMDNEDGAHGAYWAMDQTTSVGKSMGIVFEHIDTYDWWVTMNIMRSDYYHVAVKFGVDRPEFYAGLAKAFLFDKDAKSPKCKLAAYYHNILV